MKRVLEANLTFSELQGRLRMLAQRALVSLCGTTTDGRPLGKAVSEYLTTMAADNEDPAKAKDRADFLARCQDDPKALHQLCAVRVQTYNNFILADQNIMPFFYEIVNLADDERPAAQNTTDQEIRVTYVGADGEPDDVKVVRKDEEALINLHYLTTKEIRYRKEDIYRGNIVQAALQTLRVSYDMKNQMEDRCFKLLTASVANGGCFGAFDFTNPKKVLWVYLANSRINKSNLPTTNDITVPGTGAGTKFRFKVFKSILKYGAQWGGAFVDGPLTPTGRVLVPSLDESDIADEIVPSGSTNNAVANDLLQNGWTTIGYLGRNWTLVADNTLAPGTCYAEYNRKPGKVFLKPGLDKERVKTDEYENDLKNEERRWMRKPFGAYINSASRMNTARFLYAQ